MKYILFPIALILIVIFVKPTIAQIEVKQAGQSAETRVSTTESQIMPVQPSYDDIFDKIRTLESGKGTAPTGHHKYCEEHNGWNQIGYDPQDKFCFTSMEQAKAVFIRWMDKRKAEGLTLQESLCLWNVGIRINNCAYAHNYMSL